MKNTYYYLVVGFIMTIVISCVSEKTVQPSLTAHFSAAMEPQNQTPPTIVQAKCATCHVYRGVIAAPILAGSLKRVPNEAWFIQYITQEETLIHKQDAYTKKINQQSAPYTYTHHFNKLKKEELDSILWYAQ